MGRTVQLELMGEAPNYVRQSAQWKCMRCGRVHHKSYNNIKANKYNCACRWQSADEVRYHALAHSLGLEWRGSRVPQNNRETTTWFSPQVKRFFSASYKELGYRVPKRLQPYIKRGDAA